MKKSINFLIYQFVVIFFIRGIERIFSRVKQNQVVSQENMVRIYNIRSLNYNFYFEFLDNSKNQKLLLEFFNLSIFDTYFLFVD